MYIKSKFFITVKIFLLEINKKKENKSSQISHTRNKKKRTRTHTFGIVIKYSHRYREHM